ncbi:MAG: CBS domain-containing protein [Fimbriimonadaceae bacterium]|nr:CBS domain-containing protein [Fimbriimonadaceae bacterium]QYK55400.1 MAG: CBS domain-containing protein [Fimbriimonadaceae bacterium]
MTLREVLHAHVPTLTDQSTVRDAVDKMDVYQFPALAVLDQDGYPMAILTEGDLCRAVGSHSSLMAIAAEPAVRFATPSPTVESPDTEVSDALHRMISQGITMLPVVEDDRLSGVVLRVDLMQAILLDAEPAETP